MTREDAKRTLQDMWECLFNEMTNLTFDDLKEHGILDNYSTAFNMALSALDESADIEKIRTEIAEKYREVEFMNEFSDGYNYAVGEVLEIIDKYIGGTNDSKNIE